MKYLPWVTIVMWLSTIVGYFYAPSVFLQPSVLLPLFTLLSIFIPICFWTLRVERKFMFSTVFIAIFFLNVGTLSYKFVNSVSDLANIEPYANLVPNPEDARLVVSGKSEQSRMNMSRHLYENSGVITAYKKDNGELALFTPTKLDNSTLLSNLNNNYRLIERKEWLRYFSLGYFLLISIHIITFIVALIYLIMLEGPGGRKPKKVA